MMEDLPLDTNNSMPPFLMYLALIRYIFGENHIHDQRDLGKHLLSKHCHYTESTSSPAFFCIDCRHVQPFFFVFRHPLNASCTESVIKFELP